LLGDEALGIRRDSRQHRGIVEGEIPGLGSILDQALHQGRLPGLPRALEKDDWGVAQRSLDPVVDSSPLHGEILSTTW
jgi:hypothetical protein